MKDFLGKELAMGDEVIFIAPGYRRLVKGKITRFMKTFMIVEYDNTWNQYGICELKQSVTQVVKV